MGKQRNDGRRSDPFGFGLEHLKKSKENPCFECGDLTTGRHHVVPVSKGGTKQIPMCADCHSKVHGEENNYRGELIKRGLQKAKERGIELGAPVKLTGAVVREIREARGNGQTIRSIAKSTGLSIGTVHKALKK